MTRMENWHIQGIIKKSVPFKGTVNTEYSNSIHKYLPVLKIINLIN